MSEIQECTKLMRPPLSSKVNQMINKETKKTNEDCAKCHKGNKQGAMHGQGFGEDYQKCLDVTFWLRPKTCVKRSSLDCLKTK